MDMTWVPDLAARTGSRSRSDLREVATRSRLFRRLSIRSNPGDPDIRYATTCYRGSVTTCVQHSLSLGEDMTFVSHTSAHDSYRAGDDACQTTTLWQVVDNELVMQHFKSVCP